MPVLKTPAVIEKTRCFGANCGLLKLLNLACQLHVKESMICNLPSGCGVSWFLADVSRSEKQQTELRHLVAAAAFSRCSKVRFDARVTALLRFYLI
jgi:hypothetical protein